MEKTRQYFTLVYGVYDESGGRFRYVVAGHPSPLLLRRGEPPVELPGRGLPVGMIEDASYRDETVSLAPGDRIYIYTDGVTEALDASEVEFGRLRLMAEIERARDLPLREGLERVAEAVRDWSSGGPGDDVSLLAIERVAPRPGPGSDRGDGEQRPRPRRP
jgi:sigma-B regulation protein RsbU (phosphoserine phosphatase)